MTTAIASTIIATTLALTPAVTMPPTNQDSISVFYSITDWLSCSKKPQLPWCK
ncbi:hypothetical protein [Corynebacterium riegelii]|uniref:hypothetical protein n=1 Tax=Corynebacterium riegelii TaxID=156976 RepID=UPI002889A755|nr:hypothetical protein [Corynebacterium riegelii]